jgi:hypothetical protein
VNSQKLRSTIQAAFGTFLLSIATSVFSQNASVGDLVELVTGLGPILAEVVVAPDASGYVTIQLPTGKQVPVNTQKLRLIQPAGKPNAAVATGAAVSWSDGGYVEKGNVVKVNGEWCQVKTPNSTTIGWMECKSLKIAGQANAPKKESEPAAGTAEKPIAIQLQGNWENADGTVKLEFQKANKCFISFGPVTGPCTYKQSAKGVNIDFGGDVLQLAANDDGSLSSSDPDATMPIRLKKK